MSAKHLMTVLVCWLMASGAGHAEEASPARVLVYLPATARLEINDQLKDPTGAVRVFDTPPLEPGNRYSYELRATWTENGRTTTRERKVRLRAGKTVVADLRHELEPLGGEKPTTAKQWLERGQALTKRHELDEAIDAFGEALKLDPQNVAALVGRADAHNRNGEPAEAIVDCAAALQRDPNSAAALAHRASAYLTQDQADKALEDCSAALRIEPNNAAAHSCRTWAFSEKEKYDLALAEAKQALACDPEYAAVYATLGSLHNRLGEQDEAIRYCNEAIRRDPHSSAAYNNRAWAHQVKKELAEAVRDATEAIRCNPRNFWAYNNRGNAYRDQKEFALALADYQESLRINPNRSVTHNLVAGYYFDHKQYDAGIEWANAAIRLDPKNAYAWHNRGVGYSWKGNYEQAISDYSEAIRIRPNYAKAFQNRARSLSSLRRTAEADADLAMYGRLLKDKPERVPRGEDLSAREAGFSIWLPGAYDTRTRNVQFPFGAVSVVAYGVLTGDMGYAVQGTLSDYPNNPNVTNDDLFDNARDAEIAQAKGKLIDEKDIALGAFPGREVRISAPGFGVLRTRIYLAKQRIYVLKVLGPAEFTTSATAEKFLESFKVTR